MSGTLAHTPLGSCMSGEVTGQKLLAEATGLFVIVLFGSGAVISLSSAGPPSTLELALSTGLALSVVISAMLHISGAHFNPAVTISMLVSGRCDGKTAASYIIAQLIGGTLAGALLYVTLGGDNFSGTPRPGSVGGVALSSLQVVAWEAVLTAMLMLSIMGTVVDSRSPRMGGWGIGGMVSACMLVGIPLTGASMNPARHFGSALFEGTLADSWMYWVGPIIGAVLLTLLYDRFIIFEK